VVDLGMVDGKFGTKHLVRVIWQTEQPMPDGKPYLVDRRYTLSLDERSTLRKDLEAWRGKAFTLAEAAGFDLERLIGVPCGLLVVHKQGRDGDRVFANIQSVLPASQLPGALLAIRDYVRVVLRTPPANGKATAQAPAPIGPSYAPPPTAYVPPAAVAAPAFDADPFGGDAYEAPLTKSDIPFAVLLPLVLPVLGGLLL